MINKSADRDTPMSIHSNSLQGTISMSIYLYKKTHRKTGLKYLGKTKSTDPHAYPGSGLYWTRHLNEHGYDYDTEIIKECQSNEEIREWGLYYSKLWNIVESKEWANLKPEYGDGGYESHTEEIRKRMKENHADVSGSNNPMYGKKGTNNPNFGKTWKWTDDAKKRVSGENNPMYGKISPNKGKTPYKLTCTHCGKSISLGNFTRWHGDNCKSI